MILDIETSATGKTAREAYAQGKYRLSFDYLKKVGRVHARPSGRVLDNLGLELWVRDPSTGEEERLGFDYTCDWSPRDPRPRAKEIGKDEPETARQESPDSDKEDT